jgi:predicted Rossmann fold nucleotide-binding protein DprA/Smf involved in DNA uptake
MNTEELENVVVRHGMRLKRDVLQNVTIVSGGQTGVDRGALEAAVALGLGGYGVRRDCHSKLPH